jgi:hypothetical protein
MKKSVLISIVAIILVVLVMGIEIVSVSFPSSTTSTQTVASTVTGGASLLYEVEFIQQGACSGGYWLAPWAVTLNNQTIVRPADATLPLSESGFQAQGSFENYSIITFSVPNGSYSYTVYPQNFLGQSGNLTVNDDDTVVQVHAAPVSCTSTSLSTSS